MPLGGRPLGGPLGALLGRLDGLMGRLETVLDVLARLGAFLERLGDLLARRTPFDATGGKCSNEHLFRFVQVSGAEPPLMRQAGSDVNIMLYFF